MSAEQKTADEVALEYGLKLVERMAAQREELREQMKQIAAERHSLGVLLTAATVQAGGTLLIDTDTDVSTTEIRINSTDEGVLITAEPMEDDDAEETS